MGHNFHNFTVPLKATRTCVTYYKYSLRFNFTCGDVIGSCRVSPIDVKVPSFCHIDSIVILNSAIWWPNNFYKHMDIVYSIERDDRISLKQYDSWRAVSNCTRKRSSRMPTSRLPTIQDSWWSTLNMSGVTWDPPSSDRHDWKHYLPASSLVGGKKLEQEMSNINFASVKWSK